MYCDILFNVSLKETGTCVFIILLSFKTFLFKDFFMGAHEYQAYKMGCHNSVEIDSFKESLMKLKATH